MFYEIHYKGLNMEVLIGYLLKLVTFTVIGFVAFIHELGHFLVAMVQWGGWFNRYGTERVKTIGETEHQSDLQVYLLAHEDAIDTKADARPGNACFSG